MCFDLPSYDRRIQGGGYSGNFWFNILNMNIFILFISFCLGGDVGGLENEYFWDVEFSLVFLGSL